MNRLILFIFLLHLYFFNCKCHNNIDSLRKNPISFHQCSDKFSEEYYTRFFTDSSFQYSRINFPIEHWYYEEDEDEEEFEFVLKQHFIESNEWKYHCYILDEKDKSYILKTYKVNNFNIINFKGIDTGLYCTYYFKMKDQKWYLFKVIDESN